MNRSSGLGALKVFRILNSCLHECRYWYLVYWLLSPHENLAQDKVYFVSVAPIQSEMSIADCTKGIGFLNSGTCFIDYKSASETPQKTYHHDVDPGLQKEQRRQLTT